MNAILNLIEAVTGISVETLLSPKPFLRRYPEGDQKGELAWIEVDYPDGYVFMRQPDEDPNEEHSLRTALKLIRGRRNSLD